MKKRMVEKLCGVIVVTAVCCLHYSLLGHWTWLVGAIGFIAVALMHEGDVERLRKFLPARRRKKQQRIVARINLHALLARQIILLRRYVRGDKSATQEMKRNEEIFEEATGLTLGDEENPVQ